MKRVHQEYYFYPSKNTVKKAKYFLIDPHKSFPFGPECLCNFLFFSLTHSQKEEETCCRSNALPSGRRGFLVRLVGGLRVSDDLPVGDGVAHVGGAPAAARPRQQAKAAAERRGGGRQG